MIISRELAGFSGARADDLRKAIGKKNREAMAKLKPEFVAGCQASGTAEATIDWLWVTNEKSADYSFNKSHAACYALISYRTAWLRANYPFMRLTGEANVLVMPAVHSASISTKLVQSLGGATVLGPIVLGLCKSVQICSLSASVSQILNMATFAAYEAPLGSGSAAGG